MLVGTIGCQHWCSDCCGLAERERVWQGKCASYLSEKRCLCSKLSVWSHSNFVCLPTLNLSSRRILSRRRLAQAGSIRNLFCQPFPEARSILPAVEHREDAHRWREQFHSLCWAVAPESCPDPPSPRRANLSHRIAAAPSQADASAEPRHAALASSCLIPRRGEMLHLFLVICFRTWNRGIKIILFDLKVFSCCQTLLSPVLLGEPLHGRCSELCFWLNWITWHLHFYNLLKALYPVKLVISKL